MGNQVVHVDCIKNNGKIWHYTIPRKKKLFSRLNFFNNYCMIYYRLEAQMYVISGLETVFVKCHMLGTTALEVKKQREDQKLKMLAAGRLFILR